MEGKRSSIYTEKRTQTKNFPLSLELRLGPEAGVLKAKQFMNVTIYTGSEK